ncbi:MAG TPA: PEPxxWA-CTERM sorting domain-containing protein [Sphingobium sp.]|nr:PEPxxWA-CTERM sorting domain-containing protein [Sphingobium sp.]
MKTIAYAFGLLAAVGSASAAQAVESLQSYTFNGLLYDNSKTITGSFTLLQDDATQTARLDSIDFTIGSTIFTTANTGLAPFGAVGSRDAFILFGNQDQYGQGVQGTTEDFAFTFNPFLMTAWQLLYSEQGMPVKSSSGGNLTLALIPSAVPEPATWAMMIGGLALIGVRLRGRKAAVRFA